MDTAWRAASRLQVFNGALRPLVLDQQVQAMSGKKRVAWVGVANIRCRCKRSCNAWLSSPRASARAPPSSLRREGKVSPGSDDNAPAALTSATNATAALRAAQPRAPPSLEFGDESRDIGMKSGDLTQQIRRVDRVRTFAAEDGEREGPYPLMRGRELADQARMYVPGGEHVADQAERGNSYHDRRTAVDASSENVLRRVDLRHSDLSNRIA